MTILPGYGNINLVYGFIGRVILPVEITATCITLFLLLLLYISIVLNLFDDDFIFVLFCFFSANAVLCLPYVQQHLNNFITEKEVLQQQIQTLRKTATYANSPPVLRCIM